MENIQEHVEDPRSFNEYIILLSKFRSVLGDNERMLELFYRVSEGNSNILSLHEKLSEIEGVGKYGAAETVLRLSLFVTCNCRD